MYRLYRPRPPRRSPRKYQTMAPFRFPSLFTSRPVRRRPPPTGIPTSMRSGRDRPARYSKLPSADADPCGEDAEPYREHPKNRNTDLDPIRQSKNQVGASSFDLPLISCLSRQYSGLYLSSTLPTLLPASDIPDRCTIGGLPHDYRNPPPTDYFRIFPTIRSILRP